MYTLKTFTSISPDGLGKDLTFDTLDAAQFTAVLIMGLVKRDIARSGESFTEVVSEYGYRAKCITTGFVFGYTIEEVGA